MEVECPYPECTRVPEKKLMSHLANHMGYHRQVCHTCEFKCFDPREMFEHGKSNKHKIGVNAIAKNADIEMTLAELMTDPRNRPTTPIQAPRQKNPVPVLTPPVHTIQSPVAREPKRNPADKCRLCTNVFVPSEYPHRRAHVLRFHQSQVPYTILEGPQEWLSRAIHLCFPGATVRSDNTCNACFQCVSFNERGSHVAALHTTGYQLQCPMIRCSYSYKGSYAHAVSGVDTHIKEKHWNHGKQSMNHLEKGSYEHRKKELAERLRADVKWCFPIDQVAMNSIGRGDAMFNTEEDSAMPPAKRARMG